jgi:hypothetical protein
MASRLECKQKEQSFDHYQLKANNIALVQHADDFST